MFGVVFDITERKLTQEALSSMSGKLIEAHEQERTRIARELHDDISQRIPLITIYFEQLKRELPASDNGSALIVQQITGAPLKRTH
jgi:signal transduction histidine kinase